MRTRSITQERLQRALSYDPSTGIFVWLERERGRIVGSVAGTASSRYVAISIDGVRHLAHRLAWLYVTGESPPEDIDHIDRDKRNNRWSNLRPADASGNAQNAVDAQRNNITGLRGVSVRPYKAGRFVAKIALNGKSRYLGTFPSAEEAHEAYLTAKESLHPFRPN